MSVEKGLFQLSKPIMITSGSWKLEIKNISKSMRFLYELYSTITMLYHAAVVVCSSIIFVLLCQSDLNLAFESLSKTTFVLMLLVKKLLYETKPIVKLTDKFQKEEYEIINSNDHLIKKTYMEKINFSRKLIKANIVTCMCTCAEYLYSGWFDAYSIRKKHRFDNETYTIPSMVYLWYPFDERLHPFWALTLQTGSVLIAALYCASMFPHMTSILMHFVAKFKLLQLKLKMCCNEQTNVESYLKTLIAEHQSLIESVTELNNTIDTVILLEYSLSSILMATTLLNILAGRNAVFNTLFFIINYMQFFMLSLQASEFKDESMLIGNAVYDSSWYNKDKSVTQLLLVVLHRSQNPLPITIGKFGPLMADAALSRLKLVYSYVSLVFNTK